MTPRRRVTILGSLVAAAVLVAIAVAIPRPPSADKTSDDKILGGTPPATGSASPTAAPVATPTPLAGPASAPTEVHGVPVISVSEAIARLKGEFDDTELAVRGWYVPPSTVINCANTPADANPLRQFCSTGSAWLMESPDVLEEPTTGDRRGPTSPALNPVILGDVQFPLGNPGFEPPQIPLPVVVLGHFADRRGYAFDGLKRFVVDALVWRAGRSIPPGGVIEYLSRVETAAVVTQRIERDLGRASAMWIRLVTPRELEATDPDAVEHIPELKTAAAIWVARRLTVENGRTVVRTAFTVEGSDRVWTDERGGGFFLKTTIDVKLPPVTVRPVTVQIIDQADAIVAARTATDEEIGRDPRAWISHPGPVGTGTIDVARGARPNELVIRWTGGACDTTWHLDVWAGPGLLLRAGDAPPCDAIGIGRGIVVTFDAAVDPAKVEVSNGSAGG